MTNTSSLFVLLLALCYGYFSVVALRKTSLWGKYSTLKPGSTGIHDLTSVAATQVPLQADTAPVKGFAQSPTYIKQKNELLLKQFTTGSGRNNEIPVNVTDVAENYVNFCDESFNLFLSERIAGEKGEEQQRLGKIRYEVNSARQRKLVLADRILRAILGAGGLKQMEAKLSYHLRRAEIDMAFMVILQLNIEDAMTAKSEQATQVMTHLYTVINEHQDLMVSAPVRLLRMLMRLEDPDVRKQMLRQKLLIGDNILLDQERKRIEEEDSSKSRIVDLLESRENFDKDGLTSPLKGTGTEAGAGAKSTTSPQCEHIVVDAVQSWGGADVTVGELEDTIADVLLQVYSY